MRDDTEGILELLITKAKELSDSSFTRYLDDGRRASFGLQWRDGELTGGTSQGPDREAIKAFAVTLRQFIQGKERISFRALAKRCDADDLDVSGHWKTEFDKIREDLSKYLDAPASLRGPPGVRIPEILTEKVSRREVLDSFLYGDIIHPGKRQMAILERWQVLGSLPSYIVRLTWILKEVYSAIVKLADLSRQELQRSDL